MLRTRGAMDSEDSGSESMRKDFKKTSERQMDVESDRVICGSKSTGEKQEKDLSDMDEKTLLRMKKKNFKDDVKGRQYECILCECDFYTVGQYNLHIQSFEHRKRMIEKRSNKASRYASGARTHCAICNVFLNSEKQRNEHIGGARHKQICFKLNVPSTSLKLSEDHTETLADTRLHGNKLMCKYCSVELNSMQQYEEHIKSKNHLLRKEHKKVNHMRSIRKATKMLYAKNKKMRAQEQEAKQDKHKDESDKKASTKEDGGDEESSKHEVPVRVKKTAKEEEKSGGISKVLQKYGFDELHALTFSGGKPGLGKPRKDIRKAAKPPKPVPYMCDVCQVFMTSAFHLNEHLLTEEHREKMRMLISGQNAKKSSDDGDTGQGTKEDDTGENDKSKKPELYCDTCQLMLHNKVLYEEHLRGKKHKFLAELKKKDADGSSRRVEKYSKTPQKKVYCNTCQDTYDSQQSFDEHTKSKKHKFLSELKPSSRKASKDSPINEGPDPSRSKENPERGQSSNNRAREARKRQLDDSDAGPQDRKRRSQEPQRNLTFERLMYERQQIQLELEKREIEIEKQRKLVEKLQAEKQEEHEKAVLRKMIDECRQLIQERQRRTVEMEDKHLQEATKRERSPVTRTSDLWNRSPPPKADAGKPVDSKHFGRFNPQDEWEGRGRSMADQQTGTSFGPARRSEGWDCRESRSETGGRPPRFWDGPTEQAFDRPQPNSLLLTRGCTKEELNFNMPPRPFPPSPPMPMERGGSRRWQSTDPGGERQKGDLPLNSEHSVGSSSWEGPANPSARSLLRSAGQESLDFSGLWEAGKETRKTNRSIVPVWEGSREGPQDVPHQPLYQRQAQQQVREGDRMVPSSDFSLESWNTAQKQELCPQPARKVLLETPKQWQNQTGIVSQFEEGQQGTHHITTTWENTGQSWQPNRNVDVLPTGPQEPSQALQQEAPYPRPWLNDEKWHPGTEATPIPCGPLQGPMEAVRSVPSQHVEQTPPPRMRPDSRKQWQPSANVVPIPLLGDSLHGAGNKMNEHIGHIETIVSWPGSGRKNKPKRIPSWQEQDVNEPAAQPQKKPLLPLPILPGVHIKQEMPNEQDTAPFPRSQMQSSAVESKVTEWGPNVRGGFGDTPVKQENLQNWGRSPPRDLRKDNTGGSSALWCNQDDGGWHNSDRNLSKYLRDDRNWMKPGPAEDHDPRNDVGKPVFNWGREDSGNRPFSTLRTEALQENAMRIPGFDFV